MDAESPGEGQGATFTVRLPLTDIAQSAIPSLWEAVDLANEPAVPTDIPSLKGVRVLIVDDESDMRYLFKTMLEQYGVEASTAASASEALSMLTANPEKYDVLLSDIGMPDQNGYALIRQIRALSAEAGGQIPAVALTAYARDIDNRKAIAMGFQIHAPKPIESVKLAAIVASLAGLL